MIWLGNFIIHPGLSHKKRFKDLVDQKRSFAAPETIKLTSDSVVALRHKQFVQREQSLKELPKVKRSLRDRDLIQNYRIYFL